jgi:hypothetical protein
MVRLYIDWVDGFMNYEMKLLNSHRHGDHEAGMFSSASKLTSDFVLGRA